MVFGRFWGFLLICIAAASAALALEDRQDHLSVFAGRLTWGDYGTIAYTPQDIDWADSRFLGAAWSRDWSLRWPELRLGLEAQVTRHEGINDHIALNLPATIRFHAIDPKLPFSGAAFGLGASFASRTPKLEVERKGKSQQLLPYWFMELEFGRSDWPVQPFLRVHHRSDGYFFANFDTGSNGVAMGLRAAF